MLIRIVAHHKQRLVEEMLSSIEEGRADSAERILSFNFQGEMPSSIIELVSSAVKENFASQYLLHRCITDFSKLPVNTPADILEKARLLQTKRIEIASKLLKLKDPFLELHVSDDSGLSILHQSINCGDLAFAALVMDTITDTSSERKTSLNLNSRCHKKGWAPIHYAVEKLNIEAIKLLSQKGANLQATSATDKRLTPVELAKTKSKASNVSNATKELIQRCIQELTEQIALQKKIQKEAEKASSKVSHPEKSVPTSSVPTKTEANSSSSKTVAPVAVDTNKTAPLPLVEETSSSKSDKKKKKQEAKGKSDPSDAKVPSVPVVIQPTTASSSSSAVASSSTKKQTPSKGNKASQQPSIVPAHEMSVASRDEMVDRLLAMGFKESDCLAAIALYGTDIDQAISWLVEKPTRTNVPEPKPRANKEDTTKAATPEVTTTPAKSSSSESSNKSPEGETALSLQQKREELRRINREWNAKTEDEKRKVSHELLPVIYISIVNIYFL